MNAQKHTPAEALTPIEGGNKQDVRTRLLDAGLKLLMQHGYHGTSINDIVEQAAIPKGSFYYYFKSKEAFCIDLVEYYASAKRSSMDEVAQRNDLTPLTKVLALLANWVDKLEQSDYSHGCLISTIGAKLGDEDKALRQCLDNLHTQWTQRLMMFFGDAQAAGEISPELDTATLVETFILMIQGAIIDAKITRSPHSFKTLYWLFFEHLGKPAKPIPKALMNSRLLSLQPSKGKRS